MEKNFNEEQEIDLVNQTSDIMKKSLEKENSFLKKLLVIIGTGISLITILCFVMFFKQNYFVIKPDGQVQKLVAEKFDLTYDNIYKFVDTTVINTFNYSYKDIDLMFDRNAMYYTDYGLENLKKAFDASNTITYTKEYKLTKSTIPNNQVYRVAYSSLGLLVYRSYSSEEITKNERKNENVIYEVDVMKDIHNDGFSYQLKVNSIKEYTIKEYNAKFNINSKD